MTQVAEVARQKRRMKVNRYIYFRVDLCVFTPLDELKSNYAEKEQIN